MSNHSPPLRRRRARGLAAMALLLLSGCMSNELGNLAATKHGDMTFAPSPRGAFDAEIDALCGDGGLTAHGRARLLRTPYLQKVTERSATLMWTSASMDSARVVAQHSEDMLADEPVEIGAQASVELTSALLDARQWVVQLDDLEPDSVYCYRIEDAGGALVDEAGFRTAPAPDEDARPVRFVTLGDLGERTPDQFAVLEQLKNVEHDFALINGDVAYGSGKLHELEDNFFGVYGELLLSVPFFLASGNHDYKTADGAPFREVFAFFENGGPAGHERWYSFDWGPVHVVVLDTEKVTAEQASWLDADLAATDRPWKIVTGHRPTFSSGEHGSDPDMQRLFRPLFEKHGVQLVLAGHDHNYERTQVLNGVTYITAGSGGVGTRPVGTSDFTAFSEAVTHFVYVTIEGDELTAYAIDATGQDFDTMRIIR